MKKTVLWTVLLLFICLSGMVGVHWYLSRDSQKRIGQIERLSQRQRTAVSLMLEFERFRRESGRFRRMSEREIDSAKARLKTSLAQSLAAFDDLDQNEDDKALRTSIAEKASTFAMTSAKLEPTLYLRDVYYKDEIRKMHDGILADLSSMEESASERIAAIKPELEKTGARSLKLLAAMAGAVAFLLGLTLMRQFLAYARPLRQLRDDVVDLKNGKGSSTSNHRFRGAHAEISAMLSELSSTVESQRKERHQFLMAVASDLRTPLVTLQVGANLMALPADKLDQTKKTQATDLIKRSAYKISKTLDDLRDIANIDSNEIRLDEEIVDLGDLLDRTIRMLGGTSSPHPISVSMPQAPIWTLIDPHRFERVIVNLVNKLATVSPQGGRIDISMYRGVNSLQKGIDIVIADVGTDAGASATSDGNHGPGWASGPEMDLLKHWIAENGFGLILAHKILKAHGGAISAAGVSGTSIQFHVRLPEERIANGSFYAASPANVVASAGILERPRVKTMLSDQAVHFGS